MRPLLSKEKLLLVVTISSERQEAVKDEEENVSSKILWPLNFSRVCGYCCCTIFKTEKKNPPKHQSSCCRFSNKSIKKKKKKREGICVNLFSFLLIATATTEHLGSKERNFGAIQKVIVDLPQRF